jgi:hypothetical protein
VLPHEASADEIYRNVWALILERSLEQGPGLAQRVTGFVPWSRSVDLASARGRAPAGRTDVT